MGFAYFLFALSYPGVEFKYFTGEKCFPKDWDTEKQPIGRSSITHRNIDECLAKTH